MPIEQNKCKCGCDRTFYGTSRRLFYDDKCKAHWHRKQAKLNKNDENNEQQIFNG